MLECLSVRLLPHSTGSRETRSAAELAIARSRCPIARLASALPEADVGTLEAEVAQEVAAAVTFAEASPFPLPDTLLDHVG
jgi:pyruvate dehydrogenase E1 component alpha subunit